MANEQAAPHKERSFDTYLTTVETADVITPRNVHLRFRLPQGKHMKFHAGQFVQVFIPQPDKPLRRSYSIASPETDGSYFELCVTLVDGGKASNYLHHVKKGDEVTVMGALGKFSLPSPITRDLVFIATGSGIAPFRSMINTLLQNNFDKNIYLIFGNRYDGDILYQKEWEKLAAEKKNFKLMFTLSRPTEKWKGAKGYVQEKIEGFVPDPKNKDFFICGLSNMINGVQDKLLSLDVPQTQIHYEKYD